MEALGWANGITIVDSTDVSVERMIVRRCNASHLKIDIGGYIRCQVTGIEIHGKYPKLDTTIPVSARIRNVRIHGLEGEGRESDGITVEGARIEVLGDPQGEDVPGPHYDGPLRGVSIADVEEGIDVHGVLGIYKQIRIARVGTGFKVMHGAHRNTFEGNVITEPRCFGFLLRGRVLSQPSQEDLQMETSFNMFTDNLIRRVNWDMKCDETEPKASAISLGVAHGAVNPVHHNHFTNTTIDCPDPNRATVISFFDKEEQGALRTRENAICHTILRGLAEGVGLSELIQYHPDPFGAKNVVDPLERSKDKPTCSC